MYRIASWNVNSIKVRVEHVVQWLEDNEVDVLALQEIKCLDEQFPISPFIDLGYEVVVSGQKTYNGVAIISRKEADDIVTDIPDLDDPQRRILAATIDGIRVINLYVPNGQSIDSEKYHYKLDWLNKVTEYIRQEKERNPKVVVLGDFNIAPEDIDVYDPKEWKDCVLVSAKEREALERIKRLGFADSFRLCQKGGDHYSWWDYRGGSFRQNKGLRIDLILISGVLADVCQNAYIDKSPRSWERASDHTPVSVLLRDI